MVLLVSLLALVSLAHAQETTTDTSSDPPVALQQNSLVKLADNTDEVDDEDDGLVAGFVAGDPGATPPSAASYRSYAVSFTTGSDAGWYQLVEVLIATKVTGTPLARLSIHRDHEGSPHAEPCTSHTSGVQARKSQISTWSSRTTRLCIPTRPTGRCSRRFPGSASMRF